MTSPPGLVDDEREQGVGGDEVGVDGEAEESESAVEVAFPDRSIPVGWAALEVLASPNVVDQYVNVAVLFGDCGGERLDLGDVEVVCRDWYADPTSVIYQLGCLFDCLAATVIVR